MNTQEFTKIVADRVHRGVIEILKDAKARGKTLDDVIAGFEKGLQEKEPEDTKSVQTPDSN